MVDERAPDFAPGYPSGGERIGPAWQHCWLALADGEWRGGADLAKAVAVDVLPKTIMNLLSAAAAAGLLERKMRAVGGRRRKAWYRRVSVDVSTRVP